MNRKRIIRKVACMVGMVVAAPVILFFVLAILLYIPPVQQWVKGWACRSVSEATQTETTVSYVRLSFPLDLNLHATLMKQEGDTVLFARTFRLGVRVLPLFRGCFSLDGISLSGARVDTRSLLSDIRLKGKLGWFHVEVPADYSLVEDTACLGVAHLRNARLDVLLSDTAHQDTVSSEEPFLLQARLARADLRNVAVRVVMLGDSMRLGVTLCRGLLDDVRADVGQNAYTVRRLSLKNSCLDYDIPYAPREMERLDVNHIRLSRLSLSVDSLCYAGGNLDLFLRHLSFRESCGWHMSEAGGRIHYDSTLIRVSGLSVQTPYTRFHCDAVVPMSSLSEGGNGQMDVTCSATVGVQDIRQLAGPAVESVLPYLQSGPVGLNAHVQGNVDRLRILSAEVSLGKALTLDAEGEVKHVLSDSRQADFRYRLRAGQPALLSSWLPSGVHIPHGFLLAGRFSMEGSRLRLTSSLPAGQGHMDLNGWMGLEDETYDLRLRFQRFSLGTYLPEIPLSPLTADICLEGRGFDFQSLRTHLSASARIHQFGYGSLPLDSLQLDARLANRQVTASFLSDNTWLKAALEAEGAYSSQEVTARLKGNVEDISIDALTGNDKDAHLSTDLLVVASASSGFRQMEVKGLFEHLHFITPTQGIPADSIGFLFSTAGDHTLAVLKSGDFKARLQSERSLDEVLQCVDGFVEAVTSQVREAQVNQEALRAFMPGVSFTLKSGRSNPVAQLLKIYGYTFEGVSVDLKAYPETGLNGQLEVTSLRTGTLLLDKTTATITQDTAALHLHCAVENTSRRNPNRFKAYVDGSFMDGALSLESRFKDAKGKDGIHFGLKGEMTPQREFSLHVFPETSIIAYRKFKVNKDNFITISPDLQVEADVDLLADDMTGLKINAGRVDSVNDITVSLSRVNVEEICSVFPYLPPMSGFLGGDFHIVRQQDTFSASGAMDISRFHYGTYDMGDFNTELVFMPEETGNYHLNALVFSNGNAVAEVDGIYTDSIDGIIDAQVTLDNFPCRLLNAFLPQDGSLALDGHAAGDICMSGPVSEIVFNGSLVPDSMMVLSPLYGVSLRVEDKPLEIKESCLLFDHQSMYSADNKNPLDINGKVDFSHLDKMSIDIGVKANDFMIVNSSRTMEGILFGKVYSDLDVKVKGTTQMLLVKGNLHILGKSDLTYIMKEGPLVVDDWLGGLVEFVDFSDTVHVADEESPSGNVMMNLDMQVDESSKMLVELSADGDSYVRCRGGGHLTMKYLPSGDISLLGTFKMMDGEMKYELPVIPLKTFKFSGDNYVTFTGSPYNPTLHITALETTRASVNDGGSTTRMVTFNVGVAISQTLDNMGLKFIIESPEDLTIQNELAAMSEEDRGKMAVSMLVTGMYLSGTNKSSFKANNALNSFLQSEIQNMVGNALKTIDLSVGVEGSTTATGNAQTDYSFQFAKRLWNDRVTFIIGGKVSAGAKEGSTNQSFIDNISLEYRIDRNATRYVRLFYDNDSQDPLEGTYSSAGVGFVWRNKSSRFGDLFLRARRKSVDHPATKE